MELPWVSGLKQMEAEVEDKSEFEKQGRIEEQGTRNDRRKGKSKTGRRVESEAVDRRGSRKEE